ncbi:SH3 domain-containing protein [Mesorhizobium australicum]|uniref:Uncharacterized conserved protein YraI n=1 Tax=Mesorhizobium australicum TaxID=536018 RepID=A0A1X7PU87_9HYPH|nr:SH3 domain-containing protein [Mesorhizobium australicum]SMH54813.1 Uncharacterized conserved protein YraI [Mesorhizobium australicum]
MKLKLTFVALAALIWSGVEAAASPGLTTATVNMRAGPSTRHAVIVVVPSSQSITIVGCLPGSSWCDVVWAGRRGWVSASHIYYTAPGYSVPVTTVYHRVPAASPWVDARRDARVEYRVHRRMDRRWDRWTGD